MSAQTQAASDSYKLKKIKQAVFLSLKDRRLVYMLQETMDSFVEFRKFLWRRFMGDAINIGYFHRSH